MPQPSVPLFGLWGMTLEKGHPPMGHLSSWLLSPHRQPGPGCSLTKGAHWECLSVRRLPYTAPVQSELQIILNWRRKEKYLAKLCNWSSKIAYCHLVVLFWQPKNPLSLYTARYTVCKLSQIFYKMLNFTCLIYLWSFLNQLCLCTSHTQSYISIPSLPLIVKCCVIFL